MVVVVSVVGFVVIDRSKLFKIITAIVVYSFVAILVVGVARKGCKSLTLLLFLLIYVVVVVVDHC